MRLGDLGVARVLLWGWAGRAHQELGVGWGWRYFWVRPQRPLLMGGSFFSLYQKNHNRAPTPTPQCHRHCGCGCTPGFR